MIRVPIADDHHLVRAGIAQVLANYDDVEVVATAETGSGAVSAAVELAPDVILMDLEMPSLDGVEATRQIAGRCPQTQVVMLTAFSDRGRILDALDAGAVGYLLNKQIARGLAISEKTVKAHLTSVFRRIDVFDRTQAALWAERNGLLGPRTP